MNALIRSFVCLSIAFLAACGGGNETNSSEGNSTPLSSSSSVTSSISSDASSTSSSPESSSAPSQSSSSSITSGNPPPLTGNVNYEVAPDSNGIRNVSSPEMALQLGVGWNLGNALDAVDTSANIRSETVWGNPTITQALLSGVAAAGFDTVRLPVAWSDFSDAGQFVISNQRMNRVEEVVNYILNAGMKVVMNIHWDGGWMQPTYAEGDYVNNRLSIMWTQIARRFRDYDDRLLFAGTNEVMVEGDYGTPTQEYYSTQNSFNQTFVDAVRKTGGKNAYRYLVVQGFNTNIDHTVNFATIPSDSIAGRLLMEVHFYDPYEFTLDVNSSVTQWGANADPGYKASWPSDEAHVDAQFNKMKTQFVDQGIGVILGEYGVEARANIDGHEGFRTYWNEYVTGSALRHGMAPIYWDNGYPNSMGLFNRSNGDQAVPLIIQAIVGAQP